MTKRKTDNLPGATCYFCFGRGHRDTPIIGRTRCTKCNGTGRMTDKDELIRTSKVLKAEVRRYERKPGWEAEVARGKAFLVEAKAAIAATTA